MQTSLIKVVLMAGFAVSVRCAVAETIDVGIGGDLASAIRNAADGDVIRLAAGRYELSSTLGFENRRNLTLQGGGMSPTVIAPADGVQTRLLKVANCENVSFRNLTFTGGVTAATADDATSAFGGAVLAENVSCLTFESCAFAKNCATNGKVAIDARGGALALVDSTTVLKDCSFTFNTAVAGQDKAAQGGAIYASNATGADGATWRVTLAMTNTTIRSNWVKANWVENKNTQAGAAIAGMSAGLEAYNCLVTANGYVSDAGCNAAVEYLNGTKSLAVFTQSTLADNLATWAFYSDGDQNQTVNPVFIRSVVVGQPGVGERFAWSGVKNACLVDSVYQQDGNGPLAPLAEGASVSVCGKSFTAKNFVFANPRLVGEGEATSAAAKERDAGWRPVDGRTYAAIYVAPNGNDTTGNGTSAAPFRTLTKAIDAAECGATIYLAEGTYAPSTGESLPIDLLNKECLTIQGAGAGKTVFDGEQDERGKDAVRLFTISETPQLTLKDLTITGGYVESDARGNPSVAQILKSNGLRFENVSFFGNAVRATQAKEVDGLLLAKYSNIVFANCSFEANTYKVFRFWSYCSTLCGGLFSAYGCNLQVDGCRIRNLSFDMTYDGGYNGVGGTYASSGLFFYLSGGECSIRNSLFFGKVTIANNTTSAKLSSGAVLFYLRAGLKYPISYENNTLVNEDSVIVFDLSNPKMIVQNCIIAGKGGKVLSVPSWAENNSRLVYNTLFERSSEEDETLLKYTNYSTEETVWTDAAKFRDVDAGDYRLADESVNALDKGRVLPWMSDATDLEGNPRLVGFYSKKNALPDLGCYEWYKKWGFIISIR